jgi:nicotinate-nucleotide pyrophosphorylase (carboxylating)
MNSPHTRLLDTRKTVPGLRHLDKMAVVHGGGVNHRIGLYDQILIKDNHIEAAGGIIPAVKSAKLYLDQELHNGRGMSPDGKPIIIEVEARTMEEVRDVIKCGADVQRILLDNLVSVNDDKTKIDTSRLQEALKIIREAEASSSSSHRLFTEASGNVGLHSIQLIAATGVDFISVGALTHSVTALDISMKIKLIQ